MNKKNTFFVFTFLICLASALFLPSIIAEMGSENYDISQSIVRSGGGESNSTNYENNILIAEISGVANSSNYVNQIGFFYLSGLGGSTYPNIILENTFVNNSDGHSFNVTAGVDNNIESSSLVSVSIETTAGSCNNNANVSVGDYFNATFRCDGVAFTSADVNITFCAGDDKCATTIISSNVYPNHAPSQVILDIPYDGNLTVHDLRPYFNWTSSIDPDGDNINYTFNLTTEINCQPLALTNVTDNSFTPSQDLCPDSLEVYNWSVRACDQWDCSSWATSFNFTLEPFIDITLVTTTMDFGILNPLEEANTSAGSPQPFEIRNDGNVYADMINITVDSGNYLWDSVGFNSVFFQAKARLPSGNTSSFNVSDSVMTWTNLGIFNPSFITRFNHSDGQDSAYIDILVQVPGAEPVGAKTTTMDFVWEETPYRTG